MSRIVAANVISKSSSSSRPLLRCCPHASFVGGAQDWREPYLGPVLLRRCSFPALFGCCGRGCCGALSKHLSHSSPLLFLCFFFLICLILLALSSRSLLSYSRRYRPLFPPPTSFLFTLTTFNPCFHLCHSFPLLPFSPSLHLPMFLPLYFIL